MARAGPVADHPVRLRSTHPPVGNPFRCRRTGSLIGATRLEEDRPIKKEFP